MFSCYLRSSFSICINQIIFLLVNLNLFIFLYIYPFTPLYHDRSKHQYPPPWLNKRMNPPPTLRLIKDGTHKPHPSGYRRERERENTTIRHTFLSFLSFLIYPSICLSIYLSIYLYIYLSHHLSKFLSFNPSTKLSLQ